MEEGIGCRTSDNRVGVGQELVCEGCGRIFSPKVPITEEDMLPAWFPTQKEVAKECVAV